MTSHDPKCQGHPDVFRQKYLEECFSIEQTPCSLNIILLLLLLQLRHYAIIYLKLHCTKTVNLLRK